MDEEFKAGSTKAQHSEESSSLKQGNQSFEKAGPQALASQSYFKMRRAKLEEVVKIMGEGFNAGQFKVAGCNAEKRKVAENDHTEETGTKEI